MMLCWFLEEILQLSFSEIVNANEHLNGEEETKKIVQSIPDSKRYLSCSP